MPIRRSRMSVLSRLSICYNTPVLGNVIFAVIGLLEFAMQSVDKRLACADPTNGLQRFVGYPAGAAKDKFAPNAQFWAKGVDFSCASPWNSAGGSLRAGTLISNRHIIFAKHFQMGKGTRIVFVDGEGAVCPCYIDAVKEVPNSDIAIGLLNAEVTPNIHPAKILPKDAAKYIGNGDGFPVVTFNQREKLFLTELNKCFTNAVPLKGVGSRIPQEESRKGFRKSIVTGDSGNPAFMLIGNEAILLYCLTQGGCGYGSGVHAFSADIQTAMDDLCPGYKLEEFDFSRLIERN